MVAAFWIRVIPAESFSYQDYLGGAEPDIWYNLRQIEVMVHNFPQYNWFDPMTAFPTGKSIDWGPLFPLLASGLAILTGAVSRPDLMMVSSYMGPIIGVALVPVVFLLGRHLWDKGAGLIAALFITVGTFALYYRTTYGYIDHHGLEVLLSAAFVLCYIWAISYTKAHPVSRKDYHTFIKPVLFAVLAGIVFFLGLLNMPTMILFALIVGLFTLATFTLHAATGSSSEYLLVVNFITFLVVIMALPLIGVHTDSMALWQYSLGQLLCYVFLLVSTVVLWLLVRRLKNITTYLFSLLIIFGFIVTLLFIFNSNILIEAISLFFGQKTDVATIMEMQGYELRFALLSYNYGLVLAGGGTLILLWKMRASRSVQLIFVTIWSAVMAIASIQHRRYEYYFAVNFVLLSGIAVSWAFSTFGNEVVSSFKRKFDDRLSSQNVRESETEPRTQPGKKQHQKAKVQREKRKHVGIGKSTLPLMAKTLVLGLVLVLAALFVMYSVNNDLSYAKNPSPFMTDSNWVETLLWMKENTPPAGVDYFGQYEKERFAYPDSAYGVMAWWDFGHYITYIGERIPNTNPFQDNLAGPQGAAAFFIAQDEKSAEEILAHSLSQFIITDSQMAFGKFYAIAEWNNTSLGMDPYRKSFNFPYGGNQNLLNTVAFNTPEYYRTMIARLHFYDGSITTPSTAYYMEYQENPRVSSPIVSAYEELPVAAGMEKMAAFTTHIVPGTGAAVLSSKVLDPLEELPALQHFRLVYESPGDSSRFYGSNADPRLRSTPHIKIFEYVSGARIPGEGTLEVKIITNTGREFTYSQKSVDGEFIVPYSTTGARWDVRTKGNYRILETGKEFAVSEVDVKKEWKFAFPRDAMVISNTIPDTMAAGERRDVSITVRNTGTLTWSEESRIRLGGVGDGRGDSAKFGSARFALPRGVSVAPGQEYTFTFTLKAPDTAGTYHPQYRMLEEWIQWFGETLSTTVQVVR